MKNPSKVDLNAFYYQEHSQPQFERAQELLNLLTLDASSSVLDVGCGYGNIIAEISQKSPKGRCIGIDASADMVKLAKENFPNSRFPNLKFKQVKAEEIDFKENSFDAVICFSCLLWVREPKKAISLMYKCLKPGGVLLILTYLKESAYIIFFERALDDFPPYKSQSAARTMLSIDEYRQALESHGCTLEEFRPEWRFSKYKDTEGLKAYIKGWLTCYVPLPEELQEPFLNRIVKESYSESVVPKTEGIVLPYQLLAIKARKPK